MFDKIVYDTLHFIMKYAGQMNAWAWRKHVKIIEDKRQKENEEYVKELKDKL
tara:strand:+ start:1142 stop:1297 length:156 start_codon:yes stop_codon:yes gene_type:complete